MNFWRNNNYKKNNYSKSPNNPFKVAVIIGIDNETINNLPPKSTLLAIALSPISLQIETANSVKIEIPVILTSKTIKLLLIPVIDKLFIKSIIPFT